MYRYIVTNYLSDNIKTHEYKIYYRYSCCS